MAASRRARRDVGKSLSPACLGPALHRRPRSSGSRLSTGGGTLNERLNSLQDPLGSVVAIVNSSGAAQERYAYSPYGAPTVPSSGFAVQAGTLLDWDTLFAGYSHDIRTSLYAVRERPLHWLLGAWLTRDPLAGESPGASEYLYALARPTAFVDPFGLEVADCCEPSRSKDRCFYIYTFNSGSGTMLFGHSAIGVEPDGTVFGFHGGGYQYEILPSGQNGHLIAGSMAAYALATVQKCCCLSEKELGDLQAKIAKMSEKSNRNLQQSRDPTDLGGNTYGPGATWCSSAAAAAIGNTGCAMIPPTAGTTPSELETYISKSKYCESVDSKYIPLTRPADDKLQYSMGRPIIHIPHIGDRSVRINFAANALQAAM